VVLKDKIRLVCLFFPRLSAQDSTQIINLDKQAISKEIANIKVQLIKQTKISNDWQSLLIAKQKQLDDWKAESEADRKAMLDDIAILQSQYDLSLQVSASLTKRLNQLENQYNELNKKYQSEKKISKFLGWGFGIAGFVALIEAFFLYLQFR
jgi:hypothetical protein